jgi:hypothetical protein
VGKEEIPLRPLAVLLGVALGSAIALFVGLVLTAIVLVALPEFADRFTGEWRPLLFGIAWTGILTAIAAASFIGELRARPWRRPFQWILLASIAGLVWLYWP